MFLYFVFSWIFICLFSVGSFSGVFLLPSHSWARCVSVSSCSFRLVRRGSRVQSSGFYFILFAYVIGPSCSSSLRIGDDPSADAGSGRARDVPVRSTAAGPQNAPEAPPLPLGKGKKKINLIKYPKGSDFLNSAVRHAVNVGPRKVGPSYEFIFAERYRPPTGVHIWSPDVLTFYAAFVPGMVCFF